ncbi:hypothetical protein QYE76_005730 [Lolium multiflorum]|uniref:Transposase (putative) gypsy type domain-containing protein n=1 Tax=Lolium multiflorum TaxID=4521 RepID=A0AAD8RTI5_LOLMU|nr:hypothetical protein QYE76_005730 [Lolium multiflorum]
MASVDLGSAEWERSKISTQDINLLKKLGISKKPKALCFPSEESYPTPPMEYRVSFVDHLIRVLSAPIHPFLRGLLFVYGLQLHHLTPNSILHISIFITLYEAFLGVQPNWALWKRIFFCRRNGSPNIAYNTGGVVIYVRPDVEYFDVKFPDRVAQEVVYIHEENHGCAKTIFLLLTPMIKELIRIGAQFVGYREYASKTEEKLAEANKLADMLAQKLEQKADKAKAEAAGVEDLEKRLHDTSLNEHKAAQAAREKAILKRLNSQNRRFVTNRIVALFPYFFPKKKEPATFLALAKDFNPPEDLGLKMRQENMKIAVESTVALVADSQQTIDWTKVGNTQEMETTKWRSLIKAVKPNTKKILAYLGIKPTSTPSSSKPEV